MSVASRPTCAPRPSAVRRSWARRDRRAAALRGRGDLGDRLIVAVQHATLVDPAYRAKPPTSRSSS
ncbi:hypothetical protein HBB16_12725 [Pseudonocardia sp. MCCB 268]|nr:hypothetical protein [Pseudonocardia cytotoxica]